MEEEVERGWGWGWIEGELGEESVILEMREARGAGWFWDEGWGAGVGRMKVVVVWLWGRG